MIYGNWVAIHKGFVKHLPEDRPFTLLEAMFCLSVDIDNDKSVSVAGYSTLWQWSRTRVRKFLADMNIIISYDENTGKKQNQKGQIKGQIRDRSRTDKRQIRYIPDKALYGSKNRSRTDKRQIRDRSKNTTIDPNINPNPTNELFEKAFEKWWLTFPKRNGRRIGKKDAKKKFMSLRQTEWTDLKTATENYTDYLSESGLSASDAHRFLKETWKEYVKQAENDEPKISSRYEELQ